MSTPYQPNPQAPAPQQPVKKPIYKKVWFWLLIAVIAIIAIATSSSGGGDADSADGVSDPTSSPSSPANPDTPAAESPAPPPAEEPAEEPEGPTFPGQQDDDTVANGGQTITVDDVAITATPLTISQGSFGGPYAASTITIVNNSDEQIDFNPFEFMLQDPAGASRNSTFGCSDTMLNSGNLAPGGTVTGDVCFDATGQPGAHALIFEPVFSFSSERSVWLTTL